VFLVVFVVEVIVLVIFVLVFIFVPILVLIFVLVLLGLRPGPTLRLFGEFEVELRPIVDVEFLDVAVEMLNLDNFPVLIDAKHLKSLIVLQIFIPLTDGWFVLSTH